jgi:DNA polymerase-3 subunit delta
MAKNIFLFTGEESYLLHEQINSWKKAFVEKHGDINLEVLDSAEMPLNEIMAAVNAMPFLGEKRLIFIHGLPDAPPKRDTGVPTKKDEKREEELKRLEADLDEVPESSVVVFVQTKPDKRKSFYKKLTAKAKVKEFEALGGQALTSWIRSRTVQKGGQISAPSAEYLVSLTGGNLWRLSAEIDKLTSHSPGEKITNELIDKLVVPTLEANVFQMTDALGIRDSRKAIHHLHRSLASGENLRPTFYMIVRQFRLLLQGSGYRNMNPNANATAFSAALKLHPFVARNTLEQLRNFKHPELEHAYANLLDIDLALKTSRIRVTTDNQDELALAIEQFILDFCC